MVTWQNSPSTSTPLNAANLDAAFAEKVALTDGRLTDARTPTAHTQTASTITDFNAAVDARIPAPAVGIGATLTAGVTVGATAGGTGANLWVPGAAITLTPGTWLIQAGISINNVSVDDQATCSVQNQTTSAEIVASRGAPGRVYNSAVPTALTSLLYPMTVTTSTQICPNGHPNGGSTLNMNTANMAGAPNAWITALRIA